MKRIGSVLLIALLAASGLVVATRAEDDEPAPRPRDLGAPLVENFPKLKQLGKFAAWLDAENKQVVLVGETCRAGYGLEFLITTKERAYESVLVVDGRRRAANEMSLFQQVHLALLLAGAQAGKPAFYKDEKTTVATGTEIAIEVRWKGKDGKIERTDARNWIRDVKTKKPPAVNWVFAGSLLHRDEDGVNHYLADSGDFVCVLNNPIAMLDLPIVSSGAIEERLFAANADALPPPGTPVTIILKPQVKAAKKK